VTKILVVAGAEFGMLVRTKAFIITVALVPVLAIASILVQSLVAKQVDVTARRFAVIDRTGVLHGAIEQAAAARGQAIAAGLLVGAPFLPERVEPGDAPADELRLALSDRVRRGELFAFIDIAPGVMAPGSVARIWYFSDHPTYDDLRRWLETVVNDHVRGVRLRGAGVDPDVVARLAQPIPSDHLGLLARTPAGEVKQAEHVDAVRAYVVPLGLMYILFLTIFMSAPQLMNAVMQEKMSKISEVLIGSVTAFELMLGKLAGGAATSLVLAIVYLGGGLSVAAYSGYGGLISPALLVFFLVFMALAVLFYGSIFVAVGAACSDLKDAQSLITPVMIIAVMPMFAWQAVLRSPLSPFSVAISLFPPATPFMMLLRLAVSPKPPWWQVALGVALTAAATLGCVWAAAKIFRIGILATGKSPGVGQLLRWLKVK
jgi:ABC-2 type transport system permease protein